MKNVVPLLLLVAILVFVPFSSDASWQNVQQFEGQFNSENYWENAQQFIGEIESSDLWENAQQFEGQILSGDWWENAQQFEGQIGLFGVIFLMWENAQQFEGQIVSNDYWVNAQQFIGEMSVSTLWVNAQQFIGFINEGLAISGGFEMMSYIWLLILFLPALFLGWFVGRFGFVAGLLVGTSVLFTAENLPVWLFIVVLFGVGLIFFKGESSGGDF